MQGMKYLFVVSSFFLLAACSSSTVYVNAAPDVNVAGSNAGHGQKLGITVSDQRSLPNMQRDMNGYSAGAVRFQNDLVQNIAQSVNQVAARNGFTPDSYNSSNAKSLKVSLLMTEINTDPKDYPIQKMTQVAMMVTAKNHDKTYQHVYRGQGVTKGFSTYYSASDIQKDVNSSFSVALSNMSNDSKLWQFLAKG